MFFRYTLDSFGDLAFGTRVGCVAAEGVQPPFARAIDKANVLTMKRYREISSFFFSFFFCLKTKKTDSKQNKRFLDGFFEIKKILNIGSERELAEHIKTIDDFVYGIIEERKKLPPEELKLKEDFLSRFMRMSDPEKTVLFLYFLHIL